MAEYVKKSDVIKIMENTFEKSRNWRKEFQNWQIKECSQ